MNLQTTVKFSANNFRAMLLRKVTARQLSDHTWSVPSTSDSYRAYVVSVYATRENKLDVKCNCLAGQAKQGCCHALFIAREFDRDLNLLRAITPKAAMPSQRRAA